MTSPFRDVTLDAMTPSSNGDRIERLVNSLEREVELLRELSTILEQQRQGVARNDSPAIESSIQALGRTILTLEESRRQRRSVLALLGDTEEVGLNELEAHLGHAIPPELSKARTAVQQAAAVASRDLAINRAVLDRAVQAGDAFLQRLFSTASHATPSYRPDAKVDEGARGGLLVNKTV